MPVLEDKEKIIEAYVDVRNDNSKTRWVVFKYNDSNKIYHDASGENYDEFLGHFTDESRVFGFVRIITGDELSKRAKFCYVTWIGERVSPLKKARVSTDKGALKNDAIQSFAVEVITSEIEEVQEAYLKELCVKAGGAAYGTGKRD